MAALTSQKVRASFEQVLHVDRDGGGNGATLVSVKDGDNGTTFAIQLATDHIALVDGAYMQVDKIAARDGDGLYIVDDGDNGLFIKDGGMALLGDTANANMTLGLTINQGANDDEIIALKSSDVAHGMTTIAETDTFGIIKKKANDTGGLYIRGLNDGTTVALGLQGIAASASGTKTTGAGAPVSIIANKVNGTGAQAMGADENLLTVVNNTLTEFIVDAEGDYHYDGTGAAYDRFDDAVVTRALSLFRDGKDVIQTQFDDWIKANGPDLVEMKIIGKDSISKEPFTHKERRDRGLLNGARLQKLHNGAIWQGRLLDQAIINTVRELMPDRFDDLLGKNMEALGIGHINLLAA